MTTGIEVVSVADVPGNGTGLGSSSAFTVGLLSAICTSQNKPLTPRDLAREACIIEIDRCGAPIGRQDQYAVALGGLRLNTYHGEKVASLPLPIPDGLQERLMLFHTGITRASDELLAAQQKAIADDPETEDVLSSMADMPTAAAKEFTRGGWIKFGQMLNSSWKRKRSITPGITTDAIDEWYQRAMSSGAWGGKICGAGGGGFLLIFADPEFHQGIKSTLSELKHIPFRLTDRGSEVIYRD
jgi:D-glycero-alpha-D-manno-heptose-7-phosphate kinase